MNIMANKIDGVDHRGIGIYIIRPSVAEPQPKTKIHHGGTGDAEKIKTFLPLIFADKR